MKLRLLTGHDVRRCLQMPQAIDLMADAFAALSSGQVSVPPRTKISSAAGTMLYKPALSSPSGIYVVKAVSVFPGNVARQLPVTTGLLLVNDASTGLPVALYAVNPLLVLISEVVLLERFDPTWHSRPLEDRAAYRISFSDSLDWLCLCGGSCR